MQTNIQPKPQTLRQKLLAIQMAHKSFACTEESAKKIPSKAEAAYKYTPGWQIVESIRAKMDELHVMMEFDIVEERHEMISYNVWKLINGKAVPIKKDELLSTVTAEYRFVDVDSGEESRTYHTITSGANGTDKSCTSAISTAERYALLKFFHITTRDAADEADARDCSQVPGIPDALVTDAQLVQALYAQTQQPQAQPAPAVQAAPAPAPAPVSYASAPAAKAAPAQPVNQQQEWQQCVAELAMVNAGTITHTKKLNVLMTRLKMAGFNTADPTVAQNLIAQAQQMRTGGNA